jgi:ABC-type multidrug transport system ATPase subunit
MTGKISLNGMDRDKLAGIESLSCYV